MNREVKYHAPLKGLKAGHALPKPPISTVLGPTGINLVKFCEDFNEWSKDMEGNVDIGVIVYNDLSYSILTKEQYLDFRRREMSIVFSASNLYKRFKDEEDRQFHGHR
ncbi:MAG: hypothetical protein J6X02_02120 [Bacilli bacterium]|nr:hypothetical protein [Bacilli bacterium]